jgi:hypothetical protein
MERSWRPTVDMPDQADPITAFLVRFGELSIDSPDVGIGDKWDPENSEGLKRVFSHEK